MKISFLDRIAINTALKMARQNDCFEKAVKEICKSNSEYGAMLVDEGFITFDELMSAMMYEEQSERTTFFVVRLANANCQKTYPLHRLAYANSNYQTIHPIKYFHSPSTSLLYTMSRGLSREN